MTKRPALWVVLAVFSIASAVFSWRYFTRAFPLLSIDISMDRQAALARARALAADRHLGPTDFRDAASFAIDESVQTFVELEGGGKPVFSALVGDRLFTPYRWRVRHFKESEKHEATFTFAPDGTPNGFVEQLREDAPGAALEPAAARRIAESTAVAPWGADLSGFEPVEQSQERRTGGRVDHTFVYERPNQRLGEGRYRLRLVVSGDALTDLSYFIKTPDAFSRRYEQMRSVNTAIGIGGSLAFLLMYGVGGMAFGLFVLARQRWVIWRQPVVWGTIVALAQTAARINEWPLAWMQYDTALSTRAFVLQQAALGVAELAATGILFSLSFMAAESLTRRAFPNHPRFWRLWSRDAGRSNAVLGRTAAGYLLVPVFVAYEVVLYLVATKSLGWWTPSEALFNPDVLASYAPWFSAIAKSFQAGFWEESLFRAVPIAGAALIGDRLGHRRLWIVLAFLVQAVIFGAGHAPYPTQPAYARPVELIVPSIAFGLLYLQFGLLPGIVLHFAFDAFWFAMPLFATTAAGIRLQQIMIVVMIFGPLWIVLVRRAMAPRGAPSADAERNLTWRPEPAAAGEATRHATLPTAGVTASRSRWIAVAGLAAALVWALAVTRLPVRHYPLGATRADVVRAAHGALDATLPGGRWRFLPVADSGLGPPHRFVWTTAGRAAYESLLGTYLNLPGWTVFVRTFEGDVVERAEDWTVRLDTEGVVRSVSHKLPESRHGASPDEAMVRQRARRALAERFGIDSEALKDVSAVPAKLPQRTDWTITFSDGSRTLPRGELRVSARFLGDEIADMQRFVFVPEDWERIERNSQILALVVQGAGVLLAVVIAMTGAITAIVAWSRRQFAVRAFLAMFVTFLALAATRLVNGFPSLMAALSTAQPLRLQLAVLIGSSAVGLSLQCAAFSLSAGALPRWVPGDGLDTKRTLTIGLALGAIAGALPAVSALWGGGPVWPSYVGAASYVPFLMAATGPVVSLLMRITLLLLIIAGANRLSEAWTRRRALVAALLILVGGLMGDAGSPASLAPWSGFAALTGALLFTAYVTVLRHDARVVPIGIAVLTTMATLREGWARAHPGALSGALVAIVLTWIVVYAWVLALTAPRQTAAPEAMPVGSAIAS